AEAPAPPARIAEPTSAAGAATAPRGDIAAVFAATAARAGAPGAATDGGALAGVGVVAVFLLSQAAANSSAAIPNAIVDLLMIASARRQEHDACRPPVAPPRALADRRIAGACTSMHNRAQRGADLRDDGADDRRRCRPA